MRLLTVLAVVGLLTGTVCAQIASHVVINEFVYDDSGTDNREYVELYNPTAQTVDISGWFLEGLDQAWPNDNNADYTIPAGTTLSAGGYYVIGSSNLGLVVNLAVGITNLWENGDASNGAGESIVLWDSDPGTNPGAAIVDMVTYESNKHLIPGNVYPTQFAEGQGIWGNFISIDANPTSWSRKRDGWDTDDNGIDFIQSPTSPGATNDIPDNLPYLEVFDTHPVGTLLGAWHASFVLPTVVDPTVASSNNPNAVPASPQGGNAMVAWDPAGGGNACFLTTDAAADVTIEAYVYIYASHVGSDYDAWSVGVRGTTGTFFNTPILFGTGANGNTGVAWTLISDAVGGTVLYLMDEGSGGPNNILATIPITAGVNDGWQRLRLEVSSCVVDAHFGGTYGNLNDGFRYTGTVATTQPGGIYLGYREGVVGTTNAYPLMLDFLSIQAAAPAFSVCLSQPQGAGSIQLDNSGLGVGNEIFNVVTINEPCPGGVGTGPYGGLCTANPALTIIPLLLLPNPTLPFHYTAAQTTFTWGTPIGIPGGLHIEAASIQILPGGGLGPISPVFPIDTL